jgi:hypothetical protein
MKKRAKISALFGVACLASGIWGAQVASADTTTTLATGTTSSNHTLTIVMQYANTQNEESMKTLVRQEAEKELRRSYKEMTDAQIVDSITQTMSVIFPGNHMMMYKLQINDTMDRSAQITESEVNVGLVQMGSMMNMSTTSTGTSSSSTMSMSDMNMDGMNMDSTMSSGSSLTTDGNMGTDGSSNLDMAMTYGLGSTPFRPIGSLVTPSVTAGSVVPGTGGLGKMYYLDSAGHVSCNKAAGSVAISYLFPANTSDCAVSLAHGALFGASPLKYMNYWQSAYCVQEAMARVVNTFKNVEGNSYCNGKSKYTSNYAPDGYGAHGFNCSSFNGILKSEKFHL